MLSTVRFLLLISVLAAPSAAAAPQRFDPKARAGTIAPFVDEQTVGVIHVDLARLDVDSFFDRLEGLLARADLLDPQPRDTIRQVHGALRKADVQDFYVVVSMADLVQQKLAFYAIVPLNEATDVDALTATLQPPTRDGVVQRLGGLLFVGSRRALERIQATKPDVRPDLATAFQAAGDTAAQVLLLPPKHAPRVIEEMMPNLPEEIGGGSSTVLTRGLLWAAVGVDAQPTISLRLVVQSRDAGAATALRGKCVDLVAFLSKNEEARRRLADLDKVAALLIPSVEDNRLELNLNEQDRSIAAVLAAGTPPLEAARGRAKRRLSMNNLKQLGLAMHNHHDRHKTFPAVGSTDDQGRLLLSWRVHILPFVEQYKLYKQFRLDEPWDSPHNRKLIEKMPAAYHCPASGLKSTQGLSTYRVVSGEGTVFPGREAIDMKQIKDGTSHTIMLVEVDDSHAVVWTRPESLPLDPENPTRGLGGQFKGGFNVLFCDGSVRFIPESIDPKILQALFTRDGGETIPAF